MPVVFQSSFVHLPIKMEIAYYKLNKLSNESTKQSKDDQQQQQEQKTLSFIFKPLIYVSYFWGIYSQLVILWTLLDFIVDSFKL